MSKYVCMYVILPIYMLFILTTIIISLTNVNYKVFPPRYVEQNLTNIMLLYTECMCTGIYQVCISHIHTDTVRRRCTSPRLYVQVVGSGEIIYSSVLIYVVPELIVANTSATHLICLYKCVFENIC